MATLQTMISKRNSPLLPLAAAFMSNACSRAPSVDIIGSFFPVWMVCLTISVITVACLRMLLLRLRLETEVGPLALFYPSAVVLLTCILWLVFFR